MGPRTWLVCSVDEAKSDGFTVRENSDGNSGEPLNEAFFLMQD